MSVPHNVETERNNEATKPSSSYVTLACGIVLVFVQNELNQTALACQEFQMKMEGKINSVPVCSVRGYMCAQIQPRSLQKYI